MKKRQSSSLSYKQNWENDSVHFYHGVSYRHLVKIVGGDKRVICTPPHDVPGTAVCRCYGKAHCSGSTKKQLIY